MSGRRVISVSGADLSDRAKAGAGRKNERAELAEAIMLRAGAFSGNLPGADTPTTHGKQTPMFTLSVTDWGGGERFLLRSMRCLKRSFFPESAVLT